MLYDYHCFSESRTSRPLCLLRQARYCRRTHPRESADYIYSAFELHLSRLLYTCGVFDLPYSGAGGTPTRVTFFSTQLYRNCRTPTRMVSSSRPERVDPPRNMRAAGAYGGRRHSISSAAFSPVSLRLPSIATHCVTHCVYAYDMTPIAGEVLKSTRRPSWTKTIDYIEVCPRYRKTCGAPSEVSSVQFQVV